MTVLGMVLNAILAACKLTAGIFGNSYALVADAIESFADIFTSGIIMVGIALAGRPADENHPYGHGKYEPLAAMAVSLLLFGAAIFIAIESMHEIVRPQHAPAPFTLIVLVGVVVVKEILFRRLTVIGDDLKSTAVKVDAWHHRFDAITSAAAFAGIAIAILGGPGYESADDVAALIASVIISINAVLIMKPALYELLDTAPDPQLVAQVRAIAAGVPGVFGTHKCHVRKLGFDHFVDLDILCDPDESIRTGHAIAHRVGEAVHAALPQITRILVHVEPRDDFGRRVRV